MIHTPHQQTILLDLAEASIRHGLQRGQPAAVAPDAFEPRLREPGACFVTLHRFGRLRGCIGSLQAYRRLVEDISENAFAAAFHDPRFTALSAQELEGLDLEISILGPASPITFADEADLLAQLRPGIDGLVLTDQGRRATFLPAVWESLPDPAAFLRALKKKAGLAPGHWSDTIGISRYATEAFGRTVRPHFSPLRG